MIEIESWKRDGNPDREGPKSERHSMFQTWQPTRSTIKRLHHESIQFDLQKKFAVSFLNYFINRPHDQRYKTNWNESFIAHCKRNHSWYLENRNSVK